MLKTRQLLLILALCGILAACGTDTSPGDQVQSLAGTPTPGVTVTTSTGAGSNRSSFSLRLTDAPIDGLSRVVLQFIAVEMKRESGGWSKYTLPAPQPIDLLALQGLTTADLLLHMPIEPGDYKQVRFIVDAAPMANYIEESGAGVKELDIPGGSTTGLKIGQKFTIPKDRLMNLTVDFDLRKSVKKNKGNGRYKFKSKMRLVVDTDVGFIRGTVDPQLLTDPSCSDLDADTHNAVYIYRGHNVIPGDINELSSQNTEPMITAPIKYDTASGLYVYEAAFLPEDNYTIAFTCNADLEDLEADDNLPFFYTKNASVLVTDTTFLKP